MDNTINLIICGISGRMGKLIAQTALEDGRFMVLSGTVNPTSPLTNQMLSQFIGKNAPDTLPATSLSKLCLSLGSLPKRTVVVDFSTPKATAQNINTAVDNRLPYLLGCTGLSDTALKRVEKAGNEIPVLIAPNVSLGAILLNHLAQISARVFAHSDIEILDIHHKAKKDVPSGTALSLAEQLSLSRSQKLQLVQRQFGHNPRQIREIGVASLRGGTERGEHRVFFFGNNERIELTHQVSDRKVFAEGALAAVNFLVSQQPGLYTMNDVLGIQQF